MNLHDKVRGCFLGLSIGDALGLPVECISAELIARQYGRITAYFQNPRHKYFDGRPAGSWSDDTQLSLAVARALIASGGIDLDAVASEHCAEYQRSLAGWGSTTREAVARMVAGEHWSRSALTDTPNRGVGNGVAMKVAPVGLYLALTNPASDEPHFTESIDRLAKLATMTHFTSMAVTSGFAQALVVRHCLLSSPDTFDVKAFIRTVVNAGSLGRSFLPHTITEDDLGERLKLLERHEEYPPERIIEELRGSPYVFESLPFTLMFFVRSPLSIDSLFDVVSAGGDADSNASMLGALLGSLHGTSIFPDHLVAGLQDRKAVLDVADQFCEKFVK